MLRRTVLSLSLLPLLRRFLPAFDLLPVELLPAVPRLDVVEVVEQLSRECLNRLPLGRRPGYRMIAVDSVRDPLISLCFFRAEVDGAEQDGIVIAVPAKHVTRLAGDPCLRHDVNYECHCLVLSLCVWLHLTFSRFAPGVGMLLQLRQRVHVQPRIHRARLLHRRS